MKKLLFASAIIAALALSMTACSDDEPENPAEEPETPETPTKKEWKLVWEDDFDAPTISTRNWSRIPEGTPDWQKNQSTADCCYEKRESSIVLKGIKNPDTSTDPRPFICGGLWTTGKKAFAPGRIEVRARMTSARGAWPAIWMMPYKSKQGWPYDGEIDIMEHLNYDKMVYQTMHSGYIDMEGHQSDPLYTRLTAVENLDEYHVYSAEVGYNAVILSIDGNECLNYPRNGATGQYPFWTNWDLRIDMQLGGSWVGAVTGEDLPVEMEVDWVRFYQYL